MPLQLGFQEVIKFVTFAGKYIHIRNWRGKKEQSSKNLPVCKCVYIVISEPICNTSQTMQEKQEKAETTG